MDETQIPAKNLFTRWIVTFLVPVSRVEGSAGLVS